MNTPIMTIPKFRRGQRVAFLGGQGIVQSYKPEARTWTYLVEMAMGVEPDFGRVGYETTLLLNEAELKLWEAEQDGYLAIA